MEGHAKTYWNSFTLQTVTGFLGYVVQRVGIVLCTMTGILTGRINELVTMCMMETLQINCALQYL